MWGKWEEVGAVCSWGSCVAVPGHLLGAPQAWCCCIFKKVARIRISQFWIFSTKKNRTPRASLLVVGGVQKGPGGSLSRCEQPLQVWAAFPGMSVLLGPMQSPLGLRTGTAVCPIQAHILASSEAQSLHFPKPPSTALPSVPCRAHLMVSSPYCPWSYSLIASCVCQSVAELEIQRWDKYSFEFCPSFRVSASSRFCLKLSVLFFPFPTWARWGCQIHMGVDKGNLFSLWPVGLTSQGSLDF